MNFYLFRNSFLVDLEDEQKRFHNQSENLHLDLQRLTKALDEETITRIQLENQKQTLEDEIHFLKEIHAKEIEEIKQMNLIDRTLEPSHFFRNQLSNAVRNIRQEYEQLNDQQRNELQLWYQMKVTQAVCQILLTERKFNSFSIRLKRFNRIKRLEKQKIVVNKKKLEN